MRKFEEDDLSTEDLCLLGALRAALAEAATPPADAMAAAKGAFSWRTIDADLARLTYDSYSSAEARPTLRASRSTRYLTFQLEGVRIDLEISPDRVIGQIDPPSYDVLTAETAGGARVCVCVDDLGCFVLDHGLQGQLRFALDGAAVAPVRSEWTAV